MADDLDNLEDDVTPRERPAEYTTGVAAALSALIVWSFGIDDANVAASLVVVIGAIPAAVTWLVVLLRNHRGANVGPR
jgi:hypothetical protein